MNLKFLNSGADARQNRSGSGLRGLGASVLVCGMAIYTYAQAQNAEEILRAVRASEAKIAYSATQIVGRGDAREVAKIYRSGAKRRLEWLEPSVKRGDILVDDGEKVTLFHRSDNAALQTQSGRPLAGLSAGNWQIGVPYRENGRLVRVLSRSNGRKLSIDVQTKAILRVENGRGFTALQNVDYGAVPASKFQIALPAGVKLTQINGQLLGDLNIAKRRANWFKAPTKLPRGYAFESAIVGPSEVWLRYSNGQKRFSLFQQKTDEGNLEPKKVAGGFFWKRDGIRFLASDAPESAISELASSLK